MSRLYRELAEIKLGRPLRKGEVVHHVDGNRDNNVTNNLEVVCHNCHIKRHLKKVGDEWSYDP